MAASSVVRSLIDHCGRAILEWHFDQLNASWLNGSQFGSISQPPVLDGSGPSISGKKAQKDKSAQAFVSSEVGGDGLAKGRSFL